jgi:cell division protein FtsL
MTPTAVTPAARTKRPAGPRPSRAASPHPSTPRPAHRAPRQRPSTVSTPRRVSGPVAPVTRTRVTRPVVRARPAAPEAARAVRALGVLRAVPDHALLDRIVRGRLWIPLLGVLLTGIVAMQVEVLKLNASIGHSFVRTSELQSQNERLQDTVSELSDAQRIEAAAARLGMAMPAAYTPQFLSESPTGTLDRALRDIHQPDPTAFTARMAATAAHRAAQIQATSGA